MSDAGRILLVDDDASLAESIHAVLESRGYEVVCAEDGEAGLATAEQRDFDALLTDFRMPGLGGMQLLEKIKAARPTLPVVMMTAFSTTDRVIEATKKGAFDYLIKPFEMPDLLEVIAKAVASSRLTAKPVAMGEEPPDGDAIIGSSRAMQSVFKEIGAVADKPVPVLILGETGSGKELVARAIFQHSGRADKPFVAVNCAAIPDTLIESELFGHEKGAFTNAVARRIGRFEQANGGTLFLDEIGDLPAQTQVKLLRVLQEKTISRVGGNEAIPIDVRVISATHCNLGEMIKSGKFREDLLYRLNTSVVQLPALRDRRDDIPQLATYFIARYAREFEMDAPAIHKDAMTALVEHDWPGNVRQLENIVRRALIDSRGMTISVDVVRASFEFTANPATSGAGGSDSSLSDYIRGQLLAAKDRKTPGALETIVEDLERELYRQAVELAHGNQTKIAKWIGVSRLTVREKLNKYELFPKRGDGADD
jgi:nitrogen regulation protein NR(I)